MSKLKARPLCTTTQQFHEPGYRVYICAHRCARFMSYRRIKKVFNDELTRAGTKNGRRIATALWNRDQERH